MYYSGKYSNLKINKLKQYLIRCARFPAVQIYAHFLPLAAFFLDLGEVDWKTELADMRFSMY